MLGQARREGETLVLTQGVGGELCVGDGAIEVIGV